ncbi:uncharacterized protein CDAR_512641, partial [Caerostris darwini]
MNSVQDLIQFILQNKQTFVFGNLGRYPQVLYNALAAIPHLNVMVISTHYPFSSTADNRIRVVSPTSSTLLNPCDLLVIVEPSPFLYIEKSVHAARMVVFASHFNIKFAPGTICTNVAYIHTLNMDNLRAQTKRLLELQEASVQTRNVNSIQVDAVHKVIINGHHNNTIQQGNTHVIVDLSQKTTSFGMHLAFWDAFDFMLNH